VVAQGGDIAYLDPHLSVLNDIRVSFNLYDNLTSRRPDGEAPPRLATDGSSGATAWVFKLRSGVKFHNGDPFTSADVKFSIDRTLDTTLKGNRVSTVLTTVDRVEAPDPSTAIVHTKKPDPLLPARLGFYGGQIVPKKYVESVGPETFNQKPIGTGPLRFVSWTKDDRVVLEANGDYWGGKPDFDRLILRGVPEMAPRVAALIKGEVDIITQLPPDQGERVKANASTVVSGALYGGLYVLAVNSKVKPLDDPVSQAGAVARHRPRADHQELWRGRGIAPSGMIAKGDNHFDPSLPPLAYNPKGGEGAAQEKAGYKNEEIFIIETTAGYLAGDKPMAGPSGDVEGRRRQRQGRGLPRYSVRSQKMRDKALRACTGPIPPRRSAIPTGMVWRLIGRAAFWDYWRHPSSTRWAPPRVLGGREVPRRGLQEDDEGLPRALPVDPRHPALRGLRAAEYVEWTPDPLQQLEIRRFNCSAGP
jgi:ABC-type transport system substrate-binding protein